MFTTRASLVVKTRRESLPNATNTTRLLSPFGNIHYALGLTGKTRTFANKEVSEKQSEQMKGKTQHIYSTGLNGAVQREHNTDSLWQADRRDVMGGGGSVLYRDVRCLLCC